MDIHPKLSRANTGFAPEALALTFALRSTALYICWMKKYKWYKWHLILEQRLEKTQCEPRDTNLTTVTKSSKFELTHKSIKKNTNFKAQLTIKFSYKEKSEYKEEPEGQGGLITWERHRPEGTAFYPIRAPPQVCTWLFLRRRMCNPKAHAKNGAKAGVESRGGKQGQRKALLSGFPSQNYSPGNKWFWFLSIPFQTGTKGKTGKMQSAPYNISDLVSINFTGFASNGNTTYAIF